ncbi:increased rDNA silencing protein 4-like [Phalaenopsis equestris]|uniref:increased rDNA silencing protein 4-like n=1 Tax=Phalaenopsis equestris TaxID=78828 RepID=UPI0009E58B29|nr:increased rDNA silencing protein 4-like [Phalaenopsis equestris]
MKQMSRISRGHLPAGAAPLPSALLRRGKALSGVPSGEGEEISDLISRPRRGYSVSSYGEADVLNRMEKKASVGMAKAGRSAAEEFLPVEIGKHDYDWLLTPPGTPLFSSVDSADHQPPPSSQRSTSNLRSSSLLKPSRLSAHSENTSHGPRMARSSSTTRASLSTSKTPSSVLNTSTASVNSRPTTPANRVRTPATTIPRPATSHSTTPARTRPAAEKPQPIVQISRPSTPTTRAHFTASSISSSPIPARPTSRPSTPTHRPLPPASNSRLSSPARSRASARLTVSPNLPLDAPPNLRPISAGRQRAGMELTPRGNSKVEVLGGEMSSSRRALSPAVARGQTADNPAKGRLNGHQDGLKLAGNQKLMVTEKKVKPAMGMETGGYGRTMSKNSLNMAIKHMDIRQGMSGLRGASLFPHSIRSSTAAKAVAAATNLRNKPASRAEPPPATHKNKITNHTNHDNEYMPKNLDSFEGEESKRIDMKVYGGSILLKEDQRSLNWLQNFDEKANETHLFDHGFDPNFHPYVTIPTTL